MAPPPACQAATFPAREIDRIAAFLNHVTVAFESEPAVCDEFFALVTGFGAGQGGDAAAVVARATEILAARPDLVDQFRACLAGTQDESLAAARPRRSNRSRQQMPMIFPADDDPGELDAAVDDENENRRRTKRVREQARRHAKRATAAPAEVEDEEEEEAEDPGRLAQAIRSMHLVKRVAGEEAQLRLIKVMFHAQANPDIDGAAIYDAVKEALGPGQDRLLSFFAISFLPGEAEWVKQEQKNLTLQSLAGEAEQKRKPNRIDCDHAQSTTATKKRRAAGEGEHAPRETAVPVKDATSRRSASTSDDGSTGSSGVVAPAEAVDCFREQQEFEKGYSVLHETMARVRELMLHGLPDYEVEGGGAVSLNLEKLFPRHDSRAFLERMYGSRWSKMRSGLEDSRLAGHALRVVMDSLGWMEKQAVEDARGRRDKARAAEGLNDLLTKMMVREEQRRRGIADDHGGT